MGYIKLILSAIILIFIENVNSQSILDGLQGVGSRAGFGACDRIASRGVANCMENFLPKSLLSSFTGRESGSSSNGGICCNYSKYRACISGLHDGLRIAMQRERCPKSYSTRIIKSLGDESVGSPLRSFCPSNGKSQCGRRRNSGTNRKKDRKPPQRRDREESEDSPSILDASRGSPLDGIVNPIRDVFDRKPSRRGSSDDEPRGSPLDGIVNPIRGVFDQRSSRRGSSDDESRGSPLDAIVNPIRGVFDRKPSRGGSRDESRSVLDDTSSLFDPVLNPVKDIFGGRSSRSGSRDNSRSVIDDTRSLFDPVLTPVRDVVDRFRN